MRVSGAGRLMAATSFPGLGPEGEYGGGGPDAETARSLGRKRRRGLVGVTASRFVLLVCGQGAVHVLLADESLHCAIGFVDVYGDGGLLVVGVVEFVRHNIADFPHVLTGGIS